MGLMIDGKWHTHDPQSAMTSAKGDFQRVDSVLRDWVTDDRGSPYPASAGRYHLFLSHS